MDRRVVAGLVGLVLVVEAEACHGQSVPAKDPSAQAPVGLLPIPSIGDSINNTSLGVPLPAFSKVPTSPVGNGPAATVPRPPVLQEPVGLSPIEPIHQSINRGFGLGSGRLASIFRRPGDRAIAPTDSPPAMRPQAPSSMTLEPLPFIPTLPPLPPDEPGSPVIPSGRPAPFAGQSPEKSRSQAGSRPTMNGDLGAGRPAPLAKEQPQTARPQAPAASQPASPRPQAESPNPPAFRPAELPTPMPAVLPSPVDPASPLGPTADLPPAPVIETAATPLPIGTDPLQGMELVATATPPAPVLPAPAEKPSPEPIPSDPEVKQTSLDPGQDETALRMKATRPKVLPYATLRAAAVGDQIITINELNTAVNDELKERMGGQQGPMTDGEAQQLREVKNMVAASVLNRLIDQSLILQQAKHKMQKNDKAQQQFNETLEKIWKSDELPPLLRKYGCANAYELKAKLAAEGKSYEAMKEVFRKKILSNEFLRAEIHNKLTCDLSEMRAYYVNHLKDFEQPARMTWREVEISFAKYPNRAAARKKAEDVLARLLHDENFETVAKTASDGPTASQGGVYIDMQPGSYGIPVVNDELNRIPIGQVSQILEAPGSFHIVRVDSRREKGPLRFDEVQDQIKNKVFEQNFGRAVEDYLTKLRAKTLIRTMFDNTESDPNIVRRNTDPAVRPASGSR